MSYPNSITNGSNSPTAYFNNVPTIVIGAASGASSVLIPLQGLFDGVNQYVACINLISAGHFILNMQQVLANQVLQLISTGFGSPKISSSDGSLIDGQNSLQLNPGSVIGIRWNATDSQWEVAS